MSKTRETLYELNADETIRQQCLARQDYYRTQNSYKKLIEEQAEKLEEQAEKLEDQTQKLEDLSECNTKLIRQMEEQKQLILKLQEELQNRKM